VLANTLVLPSDPELEDEMAEVVMATAVPVPTEAPPPADEAGVGEVRGYCRVRGWEGDASAVARMVGAGLLVDVTRPAVVPDGSCVSSPRIRSV
jgi:hypothetical protein